MSVCDSPPTTEELYLCDICCTARMHVVTHHEESDRLVPISRACKQCGTVTPLGPTLQERVAQIRSDTFKLRRQEKPTK